MRTLFSWVMLLAVPGCTGAKSACGDAGSGGMGGQHGSAALEYSLDLPNLEAKGSSLKITGRTATRLRLESFSIASVPVKGNQNYESWEVEIPASTLEANRTGTQSTLSVSAKDTCQVVHHLEPILVEVEAPSGTTAPGLRIALIIPNDECYLPAGGTARATIEVRANGSAEGVRVTLAASKGKILGARSSDSTVLLTGGTATASAVLLPVTDAPGTSTVTAAAGEAFSVADAIEIAAAPSFSGVKATYNEVPAFLEAATRGRLKECSAQSTASGSVLLSGLADAPQEILNQSLIVAAQEACDNSVLFDVAFAAGTPTGATMKLQCRDTFNQAATWIVTSMGPKPSE
jgi:hypothetical protein